MRRILFFLGSLLICSTTDAQTKTLLLKPGPVTGEDVAVFTSHGCTMSGYSSPWEFMTNGSGVEMLYVDWTFYSGGCSEGTARVFIRFKEMPRCAVIKKAMLTLHAVNTSTNWGTSTFDGSPYTTTNEGWLERITGPWDEATMTWITQPPVTPVNRVAVPASTARWGWSTTLDVTTLVSDIIASGANNGFRISLQTEAIYRNVILASSDNTDSTLWPELLLTYESGGTADITATPDTSVCLGDRITLHVSGADTFHWSPASGLSNPDIPDPSLTVTGPGTYIVKGASAGCSGYDTVHISIHDPAQVSAGADTSVCIGALIQLSASGTDLYHWSPSENMSDPDVPDPFLSVTTAGAYIVTGKDIHGCTDTDTMQISAAPGAIIIASAEKTIGCIGDTIHLLASGGVSYTWYPPTGLDKDTGAEPLLNIISGMDYVVTGRDSMGCIGMDTISIESYPAVNINAYTANNQINCLQQTAVLQASGGVSYEWSPAIYCDDPEKASTAVHPPQTLVFTLTGANAQGCKGQDTITIFFTGDPLVHIPNSFTPNKDGLNDKIQPYIVCDFELKEFSIYNRWGQQVFTTTNKTDAWDGTLNGTPLDPGTFFYYIKGLNGNQEKVMLKGDITLIR